MIQRSLMKFNGRGLGKKHYRNKLKQVRMLILQLKTCWNLRDPYTRVLRPKDYELLKSSNFGSEINGVGLQLGEDDLEKKIKVISTIAGSPAEEAGIISGDFINKVNGTSSDELGLAKTASKLRGESGTKVLVEVINNAGEVREIDLERRSVDLRPVRTKRLRNDSHIGYLRITHLAKVFRNKLRKHQRTKR